MKFFLAVILLFSIWSCKKSLEADELIIPVSSCVTQQYDSGAVQVCFDSLLEESRCPINADCVWQGVAKARFFVTINSVQHTMILSTLDLAPHYNNDALIDGYHFQLQNIFPYPGTTGELKAVLSVSN